MTWLKVVAGHVVLVIFVAACKAIAGANFSSGCIDDCVFGSASYVLATVTVAVYFSKPTTLHCACAGCFRAAQQHQCV